jgi:hypothetical protein
VKLRQLLKVDAVVMSVAEHSLKKQMLQVDTKKRRLWRLWKTSYKQKMVSMSLHSSYVFIQKPVFLKSVRVILLFYYF